MGDALKLPAARGAGLMAGTKQPNNYGRLYAHASGRRRPSQCAFAGPGLEKSYGLVYFAGRLQFRS